MSEECRVCWGSHGCDLPRGHVTDAYPWHVCLDGDGRTCSRVMEIIPFEAAHLHADDERVAVQMVMAGRRWAVSDYGHLLTLMAWTDDRGGNGMNGDGTWPPTDGQGCPVCGACGGGGHGGGCPNSGIRYD